MKDYEDFTEDDWEVVMKFLLLHGFAPFEYLDWDMKMNKKKEEHHG